MTMKVHALTVAGALALVLASLIPGDGQVPRAIEPLRIADVGDDVFVVAEIRDLQGRWKEVEALPGLADMLRASAESLGWAEGAIPAGLAEREALVFRSVDGPRCVELGRAPSAEAAAAARAIIDAAWDSRLGDAPLVRGVVDLARVRRMLRAWADEEPFALRALVLNVAATKIAPFDQAVFSRDIVEGELHFAAWLRFAGGGEDALSRPLPAELEPFAGEPGANEGARGPGERLGFEHLPSLLRFLAALDGVSLEFDVEPDGILARGRVSFDEAATDRP